MKDKRFDKLLKLLEELSDLYPDLCKLVMNDPQEPDYIIITTEEYINEMAKSMGLDNFEDIAEEWDDVPKTPKKKRNIQ